MTSQEFNNYIKSFKRKPGEYTESEILEICLTHRNLEEGKNWKTLANILGINKSSNALRSWAYRQEQIKKALNDLTTQVKEQVKVKEPVYKNENNDSNFADLYKQKTQIRDIWNSYRADLRKEARFDRVIESIQNTISKLKELEKYTYTYTPKLCKNINEAVMLLSDLHIGVSCNNFYNKYNTEIAKKRVLKYIDKTIKYCKENNIVRLNVCQLGDAIHGIIHTSARIEQEIDAVDQIIIAAEIIAQALNRLQEAAPEVIYRSCLDNHSRLIADKDSNIASENLGRLIDWYIKERLKGTNIIFADDNLDLSIGRFKLLNNKIVIFSHGHEDSKNQAFQNYVGATKEYIDYILLAHFHSGQMKQYQGAKVFINGSVVGTENYAKQHRLFSDPEQTLIIFKEDDVIVYNINLSEV